MAFGALKRVQLTASMTYPQEEYRFPIKQLFAVSCSAHASSDDPCRTPPTRPLVAVRLVEAARQAGNRASSDLVLRACCQPDASSTGRGLIRSSTQLMSHPYLPNPGFSALSLSKKFPSAGKEKDTLLHQKGPPGPHACGPGAVSVVGIWFPRGVFGKFNFDRAFPVPVYGSTTLACWLRGGWKGTSVGWGGGA